MAELRAMPSRYLLTRLSLTLIVAAAALLPYPSTGSTSDTLWGPDTRLTDDPAASVLSHWGGGNCIEIGPDSVVHVVWHDNRSGEYLIYHKCLIDSVWTEAEPISQHSGLEPCIAAGPDNRLFVSWYWFGYDCISTIYDGTRWLPATILSDCSDENAVYPSVTVDPSGWGHVVWSHGWPAKRLLYRQFDGSVWGPCITIVETVKDAQFPTIVAGDSSDLHLCWQDDRDIQMEIYYQKYDGHKWSPPERLTHSSARSEEPCLAHHKGVLHLVWQETLGECGEVYYMAVRDGWGEQICLSPQDGLPSGLPRVAVDNLGRAHVVWCDGRYTEGEIYYRHSDPTGSTWFPEMRLTRDPAISTHSSIAIDVRGRVHVIWEDERDLNREIYYKVGQP